MEIYLCTKSRGYHYRFTCISCNRTHEIIAGEGRYGNLGPFKCPKCKKDYYATIDDHPNPSLYVAELGKQPLSLLDCDGKSRSIKIPYDGLGQY